MARKRKLQTSGKLAPGCRRAQTVLSDTLVGPKLYMLEDSANEKAFQNFQSNFDVDY
jgi:hypothetical protein